MEVFMNPLSMVCVMKWVLEDEYARIKMVAWASTLAQEVVRDDSATTNQDAAEQAVATLSAIWGEILTPSVVAGLGKRPKAKSGRSLQSWNKTPERRLLKCVLGHLIRDGKAKEPLLLEFKRLIPDYQSFFDPPGVSDSAIWGRADSGFRGGKYSREAPDVHFITKPYWAAARQIVDDGVVLTEADVCRIAAEVDLTSDDDVTPDDDMTPDNDVIPNDDKPAVSDAAE
jgi:hypothetical protein